MNYEEAVMEVIVFEKEDIVCTSGLNGTNEGDGNFGSIEDLL